MTTLASSPIKARPTCSFANRDRLNENLTRRGGCHPTAAAREILFDAYRPLFRSQRLPYHSGSIAEAARRRRGAGPVHPSLIQQSLQAPGALFILEQFGHRALSF
jgi:hypothetical protein